jgi:hypothetical protein
MSLRGRINKLERSLAPRVDPVQPPLLTRGSNPIPCRDA